MTPTSFIPTLRSRPALALGLLSTLLMGSQAAYAQSQSVCGPNAKEEVIKALFAVSTSSKAAQLSTQAQLYDKYKVCAQDSQYVLPTDSFHVAARQCGAKVSYLGSTFFEEMSCCGYDPQRRTFGCPVKIKQTVGFGPNPLPGSREYVLNCVADAAGVFQPVGSDSVHLANANAGLAPTWQFAVIANATDNLQTVQPMNGAARRARSILSWNFEPTNCNYQPIWGNVIDYQIRLNQ